MLEGIAALVRPALIGELLGRLLLPALRPQVSDAFPLALRASELLTGVYPVRPVLPLLAPLRLPPIPRVTCG